MKLTEKMSYLKGYMDALDVQKDTKEWQAISKMTDLMDEMVAYIEDLQNQVDELSELCDDLDQDLGEVEKEIFYVDEDEDYVPKCVTADDQSIDDENEEDEDETLYEAVCPSCGRTIILDEDMLAEGGVECSCGESLDFDFSELGDDLDETAEDEEALDEALDEEMQQDLDALESMSDAEDTDDIS